MRGLKSRRLDTRMSDGEPLQSVVNKEGNMLDRTAGMSGDVGSQRKERTNATIDTPRSAHSLGPAYLLWLGGLLGLHHMYFGNFFAAFLYTSTLGFGFIGWILDLFLMPCYRSAADGLPGTQLSRAALRIQNYLWQFFGGTLFAKCAHHLVCGILDVDAAAEVPDETSRLVAHAFIALLVSIGVYAATRAAVIPSPQPAFYIIFLAALIGAGWTDYSSRQPGRHAQPLVVTTLAAMGSTFWPSRFSGTVRPHTPSSVPKRVCRATCKISSCGAAGLLVWLLYVASAIVRIDVPLNDEWRFDTGSTHSRPLGAYIWHHKYNISEEYTHILNILYHQSQDPNFGNFGRRFLHGTEMEDYEVLGLHKSASLAEIKASHRKLVREYHPDRWNAAMSEADRAASLDRFRQIQRAYERLARKFPHESRQSA